jgi:diguanylate cyclase (GGDEF)-like protein
MESLDSSNKTNPPTPRRDRARKILLVGDISRAFLHPADIEQDGYELCPDLNGAREAASKKDFAAIAVVMSGVSAKLTAGLKKLRAGTDAKIILLARMYEEPLAMRLVGSSSDGETVADDYLICPVSADTLRKYVAPAGAPALQKISPARPVDAAVEEKIKHLEKLATEDDLTHLKNRRYIWEFARQIIDRAKKENGRVTLLVFDIDNFKHYNDLYGHSVGDEVLKQAAVLIKRCCRSHDVIGRIGGDEFAVVFWDQPKTRPPQKPDERRSAGAEHPHQAISIAKRFVKELQNSELTSLGEIGPAGKGVLTISGGLASFPRDGDSIQQLFNQADKALLEAKRSGKNRIYLVGKPQSDITDIE